MHTPQELVTGEDTHTAEPGERSTPETRKETEEVSSNVPAEPTTGTTEYDASQQKRTIYWDHLHYCITSTDG